MPIFEEDLNIPEHIQFQLQVLGDSFQSLERLHIHRYEMSEADLEDFDEYEKDYKSLLEDIENEYVELQYSLKLEEGNS